MSPESEPPGPQSPKRPGQPLNIKHILIGKPRALSEPRLFHRLSLIAVLAWIGLGADGLSSSAYGPEEAFRALGGHIYLAFALAAATAVTVLVISSAYSHIIEEFPGGGGGYLVALRLLGPGFGVLSGCALLVDYVLTIAVSMTAAADSMFSALPPQWHAAKLAVIILLTLALTVLNIRGVRESVMVLAPIFFLFIATHAAVILSGVAQHAGNIPRVISEAAGQFSSDTSTIGIGAILLIFARAYSLGGGTYTGIEAVSNGMPIMREPRVRTAHKTMLYMAVSLAVTAGGLIICYLLWNIQPATGKTMNAILAERVAGALPAAHTFVVVTLFAAGALLLVAAQAGFIDGPRVLANMAVDSWVPRHFATLSERFTTMNGILVMGIASIAVVLYTRGNIHSLVVMYSINVFLTFSLSMFGMLRLWLGRRRARQRIRRIVHFTVGFLLCATVLAVTLAEKLREGGWVTVGITGLVVLLCFGIRRHYHSVARQIQKLDGLLGTLPIPETQGVVRGFDPQGRTAGLLVSTYGGLGIHTLVALLRRFPGQFQNIVFISVGEVDSGELKGAEQIQSLRDRTEASLKQYVSLAARMGYPATYHLALGTDVVEEAFSLCTEAAREYRDIVFFAGQLVFRQEAWYHPLLHNRTAFSLQRRLFLEGQTMVVLPMRI
jgi:amino acid transporter